MCLKKREAFLAPFLIVLLRLSLTRELNWQNTFYAAANPLSEPLRVSGKKITLSGFSLKFHVPEA